MTVLPVLLENSAGLVKVCTKRLAQDTTDLGGALSPDRCRCNMPLHGLGQAKLAKFGFQILITDE